MCVRKSAHASLQALYVPPGSPYCVYKPMKHGRLNVGPSQSLQSLLDILEDLWTQAIHEVLEIRREDLKVGRSTGPSYSHLAPSMAYDVVEAHAAALQHQTEQGRC